MFTQKDVTQEDVTQEDIKQKDVKQEDVPQQQLFLYLVKNPAFRWESYGFVGP